MGAVLGDAEGVWSAMIVMLGCGFVGVGCHICCPIMN